MPIRSSVPVLALLASLSLLGACSASEPKPKPKARTVAPVVRDVPTALRGTIGSECSVNGIQPVLVSGLGFVVGLNGTGGMALDASVSATMERELGLRGISKGGNTTVQGRQHHRRLDHRGRLAQRTAPRSEHRRRHRLCRDPARSAQGRHLRRLRPGTQRHLAGRGHTLDHRPAPRRADQLRRVPDRSPRRGTGRHLRQRLRRSGGLDHRAGTGRRACAQRRPDGQPAQARTRPRQRVRRPRQVDRLRDQLPLSRRPARPDRAGAVGRLDRDLGPEQLHPAILRLPAAPPPPPDRPDEP